MSNQRYRLLVISCTVALSIVMLSMLWAMEEGESNIQDAETQELSFDDNDASQPTRPIEESEPNSNMQEPENEPVILQDVQTEQVPVAPQPALVPDTSAIQAAETFGTPTTQSMNLIVKKENQENNMAKELHIGLAEGSRTQMCTTLQKLLADEYLLYTKTLNFHWNVEGKHFGPLHTLFNDQYEKLLSIVDSIAERIRALGSFTQATMKEFLAASSLTEVPGSFPDDMSMLASLLADHEAVIRALRAGNDLAVKINDGGTNNFLSGLLETHEKMAWMLRAHLNK